MNSGVTHYCGVDVSRASLEVFVSRLQQQKKSRWLSSAHMKRGCRGMGYLLECSNPYRRQTSS